MSDSAGWGFGGYAAGAGSRPPPSIAECLLSLPRRPPRWVRTKITKARRVLAISCAAGHCHPRSAPTSAYQDRFALIGGTNSLCLRDLCASKSFNRLCRRRSSGHLFRCGRPGRRRRAPQPRQPAICAPSASRAVKIDWPEARHIRDVQARAERRAISGAPRASREQLIDVKRDTPSALASSAWVIASRSSTRALSTDPGDGGGKSRSSAIFVIQPASN